MSTTLQATIQPGNHVQDLSLSPGTSGTYTGGIDDGPFTAVTVGPLPTGNYTMGIINANGVPGYPGAVFLLKTGTPLTDPEGQYSNGTITASVSS